MTDAENRLRYVVIGAGMAGLLAGLRLLERGVTNFTVYEKGASVGGTWRENRYAGLTCDVPAHAYTYSFAPHPDWSRFFAPGPEIRAYFEGVAQQRGLMAHIRFDSEIVACRYSDRQWHIRTAGGLEDVADVVIAATGVLHHLNMPDIKGLGDFAGACFHSARWDDSVKLDGQRVGVVGSGSTGVQIVCALTDRVARMVHLNRSPQWIMPTEDFAYTDEDRAAFRNDPAKIEEIRQGDALWSGIYRFNRAIIEPDSPQMAEIEKIVLDNLMNSVSDPVLREKLRPNYRAACKRLIYSPSYYAYAQRPNAIIETGRIAHVQTQGVRMQDGSFHPLDVLILATGFRADRFVRPMHVTGIGGVDLDSVWKTRAKAYLAISLPDFPNFFMLNGPGGPVGNFSLIDIAERQWGYIDQLLEPVRAGRAHAISAKPDVLEAYERRRIAAARTTIFGSGCTSWYLDAEGVPSSWPWSYEHFASEMAAPRLEEYDIA